MKNYIIPIILSIILVSIPSYYRTTWNEPSIAIGSDPQIKYYQAVQLHNKGLSLEGLECIYPAKDLGFSIEQIPFGYPWAFLIGSKCFFQYPALFSFVQYLLGGWYTTKHFLFLPIFFFFLNYWIVFFIFKKLELGEIVSSLLSFFLHGFTPIFLSSLDYSELTLVNFLVCLFIYTSSELDSNSLWTPFLLGIILALNFQLRPESTIGLVLFSVLYFLLSQNYSKNFYFFFYIAFSFLLITGLFAWFSFVVYENPLGLRGLTTLQDASGGLARNYFQDWKADLFGSEFKIGLFQGFPVLFVLFFLILFTKHIQSSLARSLLWSGVVFILILPILSPYRAGVDIFGMRYFETGIYLLTIGFGLFCKEILIRSPAKFPYLIIALVIILSYYSYKSILRAIKHWKSAANLSHQIHKDFREIEPNLIVHKGLSTSYLLGVTYLEYPQIAIYSKEDWKKLETHIQEKKQVRKVLYLEWKENTLFNKEIPTQIWEAKFGVDFEITPQNCSLLEKKKITHFDARIFDCH